MEDALSSYGRSGLSAKIHTSQKQQELFKSTMVSFMIVLSFLDPKCAMVFMTLCKLSPFERPHVCHLTTQAWWCRWKCGNILSLDQHLPWTRYQVLYALDELSILKCLPVKELTVSATMAGNVITWYPSSWIIMWRREPYNQVPFLQVSGNSVLKEIQSTSLPSTKMVKNIVGPTMVVSKQPEETGVCKTN